MKVKYFEKEKSIIYLIIYIFGGLEVIWTIVGYIQDCFWLCIQDLFWQSSGDEMWCWDWTWVIAITYVLYITLTCTCILSRRYSSDKYTYLFICLKAYMFIELDKFQNYFTVCILIKLQYYQGLKNGFKDVTTSFQITEYWFSIFLEKFKLRTLALEL